MINFFKSEIFKAKKRKKPEEKNPHESLEIKEKPNNGIGDNLSKPKNATEISEKACKKSDLDTDKKAIGKKEKQIDENLPIVEVTHEGSDTKKVDTGTEDGVFKQLKYIYKPLVKKKLTILLLENNIDLSINQKILKFVKSNLFTDDLLSIINYGNSVKISQVNKLSEFSDSDFLYYEQTDNLCLFDALIELEKFVSENYMEIIENENERVKITDIDIIGIGTCTDLNSEATKENAIDCISKIFLKRDITTKYFCLTEENFLRAAEIGFRSIGAIFKNYQ